jgi:hypothetical protein
MILCVKRSVNNRICIKKNVKYFTQRRLADSRSRIDPEQTPCHRDRSRSGGRTRAHLPVVDWDLCSGIGFPRIYGGK